MRVELIQGEVGVDSMKPRGTSVDLVSQDWLQVVQEGGLSFAQLSYDFAIEHPQFTRELIEKAPDHGIVIWGRLPEDKERREALYSANIFFDAVFAEFAEDAGELAARFLEYESHRQSEGKIQRGIVVESMRGIERLSLVLEDLKPDLVLPGPFDLSKELGLTPNDPKVQAFILQIIEECAARSIEVIASTTTHPGGAAAASLSPATRLFYPGIRRAASLVWEEADSSISSSSAPGVTV